MPGLRVFFKTCMSGTSKNLRNQIINDTKNLTRPKNHTRPKRPLQKTLRDQKTTQDLR